MITSLTNEKVKSAAKLLDKKYRDSTNTFIVEGFHLVEEAKKAGLVLQVFTASSQNEGEHVSRDVIKKLSSTETPQDIVAVVKKPEVRALGNKVLVLDNVQDPGNAGTLIRTAASFGFESVVVKGVDVYSPKVLRSSQGAIFDMNVVQVKDTLELSEGYQLIGALLDKEAQAYNEVKPKEKFMLILGNEGQGISKEVIAKLDKKVYIPIKFESLNVAVAGGILMNEYKGE